MIAGLVTLVALTLASGAWARVCRYDAARKAVYAPPGEPSDYERLWVEKGRIMWTDLVTTAQCGSATVTNTDTIYLVPPLHNPFSEVTIDERSGRFAPGATSESTGQSEIEIVVSKRFGGGVDEVLGTSGDDVIAIGRSGIALNDDGDADIRFGVPYDSGVAITVDGGAGDDFVTGQGGLGAGAPTTAQLFLFGGAGVNELVGGSGPDLLTDFFPGAGNGKLRGMEGPDILDGSSGHDLLQGGPGRDLLAGSGGRDVLQGGSGPDLLDASDGERDIVLGGKGVDQARIDAGLDHVVSVESLS